MNENLFLQPKEVSQMCEAVSENKRGYLLPMVIIYMIIAMIVGLGILTLGSLDRIEANKRLHREQAFYLAEAGINLARFNLKNSSSWQPTNPYPLGAGNFQLVVDNTTSNTMIFVTSTGTVNGVSETTSETFGNGGGGFFSQGFFGKTKVQLDSGAKIQGAGPGGSGGEMGTNGSLTLMGSASINGTANLTGTALTGYTGSNITTVNLNYTFPDPYNPNNPASYWPAITIPSSVSSPSYVTTGDYRIQGTGFTLSNLGVLTITGGNVTINAPSINANFRFKEILIKSNPAVLTVIGNAVFYFDGTNGLRLMSGTFLNIGTPSTLASLVMYFSSISPLKMDAGSGITNFSGKPMDLQIYSQGTSLTLMSGGLGLQGVVFAPNATALLMSGAIFSGCIVAKDLELDADAIAKYDNIHLGSGGGITFISWTKPNWNIR